MGNSLWVGDTTSNRAQFYRQARSRLGLPPAREVDYRQVFAGVPLPAGPWDEVRLESPGKDAQIEALLAGRDRPLAKGQLDRPAGWFESYRSWLRTLPTHWPYHNPPDEIELAFDKPRCHRHLEGLGLPVPARLEQPDQSARCFVKLYCGSSCSALAAYMPDSQSCFAALERVGPHHYYNSRKVRRYQGAHCREIIEWLLEQGAHLEEWLPRARLDGMPFDLRLVTIGGEPRHAVVRLGRAPMLGLHLGAQRGSLERLRQWLGRPGWQRLRSLARAVAAAFPQSLYLGLDLLIEPDRTPRVIEVNAFGDLLPGVLWRGQDTYSAELRAFSSAARRNSA